MITQNMKKLLAIFVHPDDEGAIAGTLAPLCPEQC
jgi:LmbE family N-acetylglucosaminyl deacetylase